MTAVNWGSPLRWLGIRTRLEDGAAVAGPVMPGEREGIQFGVGDDDSLGVALGIEFGSHCQSVPWPHISAKAPTTVLRWRSSRCGKVTSKDGANRSVLTSTPPT